MKKISLTFKAKAEKALDRLEDPRETLDYSYQRQLELLTKVRHDVATAGASRARVEARMKALRREHAELEDQTGPGPGANEEREALRRKVELEEELSRLASEHNSLRTEEEQLTAARDRLQMKVESFRVRKESIKITYAAAEVQTRNGQIWSDFIEEAGSAGAHGILYPRQCVLLTQLGSSIEEITASLESLDQELDTLRQWHTELEDSAGQAPSTVEDDASDQQALISRLIPRVSAQRHSLHTDLEKVKEAYDRLAAMVQASRAQEEDAQGTYSSGEGSAVVGEAVSNMPEKARTDEMPDTGDPL